MCWQCQSGLQLLVSHTLLPDISRLDIFDDTPSGSLAVGGVITYEPRLCMMKFWPSRMQASVQEHGRVQCWGPALAERSCKLVTFKTRPCVCMMNTMCSNHNLRQRTLDRYV